MLCEECQLRPATVHITKIINNLKSELNLCEECAKGYKDEWGLGIQPAFSIPKFFAGLLDEEAGFGTGISQGYRQESKCDRCGQTYSEFTQTGRLGCNRCYAIFGKRLDPLLRRIHGSIRHTGKVPGRAGGKLRLKREVESLRAELEQLVAQEEFEKAAEVRDKIREVEKKLRS